VLHIKQQQALNAINRGENVFLTGVAGCGKSYVIDQILDHDTLICAPTGIAALNVDGITCHKAFGLPTEVVAPYHREITSRKNQTLKALFEGEGAIKRVVIDEISMLRRDQFELIDWKLRAIRGVDAPFGGIQMVVVGDFFQLEPVITQYEKQKYNNLYDGKFAFTSPQWQFNTVELTHVFRQENKRQVALLNAIRKDGNQAHAALAEIVRQAQLYQNCPDTLHLCCYNRDADVINKQWYAQVKGKESTYRAWEQGKWSKSEYPADPLLKLKVGVRVLLTVNDPDGQYVNGDRGVVVSLEDDGVVVEKTDGSPVFVGAVTWSKKRYEKDAEDTWVKLSDSIFKQLPIKYAYAISIHKSQGMTLNDVALDVGRGCFSHGQLYVALSRIKDLSKIQIKNPIRKRDLIVDDAVKQFYTKGA